jgi:hypothetical protein
MPAGSSRSEPVDETARQPVELLGCAPISSHAGEFLSLALPTVAGAMGSRTAPLTVVDPGLPHPLSQHHSFVGVLTVPTKAGGAHSAKRSSSCSCRSPRRSRLLSVTSECRQHRGWKTRRRCERPWRSWTTGVEYRKIGL